MVNLNNKIVDKILSRWKNIFDDFEKDAKEENKLSNFEMRLAALCFEISTVRNDKNEFLDSDLLIVIYEFFLSKGKNYSKLLKRMEYLCNLKVVLAEDLDFMYELENLLTCFLEQLETKWTLKKSKILDDFNPAEHSFSLYKQITEDRFYIVRFVREFNETELEFN
jgi:hypothetical protein